MIIEDVEEITNSGGVLILKAREKCVLRLNKNLSRTFKDETKKVIGYGNEEFILVAKNYIYGNIVSCHKELLNIAKKEGIFLLMYINTNDKFYKFDPDECLSQSEDNFRGGIVMSNFKINLGKNFEK